MLKPIYNLFHKHYHRRYHGIYQHAKQLFVFDMGLLAFTLFLFGLSLYLLLWKPGVSNLVDVSLSLGAERIRSGDNVHLVVHYKNNSKIKLTNAYLALRLPPGFVLDSSRSPSFNTTTNSFALADLPPGADSNADVYGKLWTNVGVENTITATLSFKQENSKFTEQSVGVYHLNLAGSVLSGKFEATSTAFAGHELTALFTLNNNGSDTATPLVIFVNGLKTMDGVTLPPGSSTSTSSTVATPDQTTDYPIQTEVKILLNGSYFTQILTKNIVKVLKPEISINVKFVGKDNYADPGSLLPVEVTWKNNDNTEFNDQKIRLNLTHGIVDMVATAKENRLETDGDDLLIDKKTRTQLANGKAGAGESFTINLRLLPTFTNKEDGITKLTIKPYFEGGASTIAGTFAIEGSSANIRLPAEVAVTTAARYFTDEGDQLGRGPLPPTVGKTTKYWIFATLNNKTNALKGGKFIFTLAPGVTFTGKQSVSIGPELEYNESVKNVSWNYDGSVPADSESGIFFEVAINPTSEQVGTQPVLVSGVEFDSEDAEVGKKYNMYFGSIKNVLPGVDQGSRSGTAVISQ
jgi:hypothetical protein